MTEDGLFRLVTNRYLKIEQDIYDPALFFSFYSLLLFFSTFI